MTTWPEFRLILKYSCIIYYIFFGGVGRTVLAS